MKKMKFSSIDTKIFSLLFTLVIIINTSSPVLADNSVNELKINFSNFSYTLYDYNSDEVYVNYKQDLHKEIAEIKNVNDNSILEVIEVEKKSYDKPSTYKTDMSLASFGTTSAYNFIRTKKFGLTELKLVILVEIYSYGSFRQINSIQSKTLSINSAFTTMSFENKDVSVWTENNRFPAIVLHYGYSGTLVAPYTIGGDANISNKLKESGFSISGQVGTTIYYRRTFDTTGRISLY